MTKQQLKQLIKEVVKEMNLKGLIDQPKDDYDPSVTKINPFDDKDFAMKSKVLNTMSILIDKENKTFVQNGVSDTQKIVDDLVANIGNLNLSGVQLAMMKLESLWNKIKMKYPKHNEKYLGFKNEVLTQLQ